ncbi:MAG TPA: hypothetical protein VKI65_08545 [Gemmataceae bacterium]|nr:hypothetical protein [Gemmataceae bacterium]
MLSEVQRKLWETYETAEGRALRAQKLLALDAFLDSLTASPGGDWFGWARSVAENLVDNGVDFVIRRPLFERALFPALLAGHRAQLPGCARWLAGLSDALSHCPTCRGQLPPQERTEAGLLRAAISHDPADGRSRQRLIQKIADRLRYVLHEVPTGVLYGIDGASPEQCQELEEELQEFCRLLAQEHLEERYAELTSACRLHFRAYRDYLLNRERYISYEDYLSQHREAPTS